MANKPLPWFRFYSETDNDPKLEHISRSTGIHILTVLGAWTKILCWANSSPVYGSLYVTAMKPYCNGDVTVMLRLSNEDCNKLLNALIELEMLEVDDNGGYRVKNWSKRQYASDNSAPRVEKNRKNNKNGGENVTPPLQDRYSNDQVTPSDTDTDTELKNIYSSGDAFENMRRVIERITGIPPDSQASIPINELVRMKVEYDDIKNGYDWLKGQGKEMKYYGQILGPARTAQSRRMGKPGGKPKKKIVRRLNGVKQDILVYDDGSEEYVPHEATP